MLSRHGGAVGPTKLIFATGFNAPPPKVRDLSFIMYFYLYDSFLNNKKYDHALARIETRLTDLGLNGKISRLGLMKNAQSFIENELKRGVKTIVAVGNDKIVNLTVNALIKSEKIKTTRNSIPIGIIPMGKENNFIAESLGIGPEEEACNALSARRIEKIDLGCANGSFFISSASIPSAGTTIEMEKSYSIEILEQGEISVINLPTNDKPLPAGVNFNPQDGLLELLICTKKSKGFLKTSSLEGGKSIFSLKKLTILNSKNRPIILDGSQEISTPVQISIIKQKLSLIVGKSRNF